jgi:hypothetical protein
MPVNYRTPREGDSLCSETTSQGSEKGVVIMAAGTRLLIRPGMNIDADGYQAGGQYARPSRDDEDHSEQAARLDRDNPRWMIVWGTFSHEFVAFPLFDVPSGTVLCCRSGPEMERRMRQVEQIYGGGRDA